MRKDLIRTVLGPVLAAGLLAGCANSGDYLSNLGSETAKGLLGEPLTRVTDEAKKGNLLAPLYATRGMINGLERTGNALTGNKYNREVGEDGSLTSNMGCLPEAATAGVVLAPVAPWSYVEGMLGGGAIGAVGCYSMNK